MCINPGKLSDGTLIACRNCWQCRDAKVQDWVGRLIAERERSIACHVVTLTYGGDRLGRVVDPRAAVLTYSDVQVFRRKLRDAGFPVRYFCVGEYGTLKGRSHWHLVLFWQEKVPELVLDERVNSDWWPHGFSQWELPGRGASGKSVRGAMRYVCKYLQKDIGAEGRQVHCMMSKKPPLGTAFFMREAERFVSAGLAPQDLRFPLNDERERGERQTYFYLRGKTADIFLEHFCATWARERPGRHLPNSELVEEWLDKRTREASDYEPIELREKLAHRRWIATPEAIEPKTDRELYGLELRDVFERDMRGRGKWVKRWVSIREQAGGEADWAA